MTMIRTYSELIKLETYAERFEYLKLVGIVGKETFGRDRFLNQALYHSDEWHHIRNFVIVRDNGCDLGVPGLEIKGLLIVHHMNPIAKEDILKHSDDLINPEFLICTCIDTHNAIHYGNDVMLNQWKERTPGDTCLWH